VIIFSYHPTLNNLSASVAGVNFCCFDGRMITINWEGERRKRLMYHSSYCEMVIGAELRGGIP
jgi:hypothetical protein